MIKTRSLQKRMKKLKKNITFWSKKIHMKKLREDIFIDDDLFSNTGIKDEDKQIIDDILQHVNQGNIRIAQIFA